MVYLPVVTARKTNEQIKTPEKRVIESGASEIRTGEPETYLLRDATSPAPCSLPTICWIAEHFSSSPIFSPSLREVFSQYCHKGQQCEKWQNTSRLGDGFSSAESETLAPEQSSFCRGQEGRVYFEPLNRDGYPRSLAYCSYYRAYLLQKEPKKWCHCSGPRTGKVRRPCPKTIIWCQAYASPPVLQALPKM
ncbi:hypothetical protein GGS21DRAFT_57200 [Xylaria nigripes]|nr:hypothetical protein GGS21DRAFT_57200 [Xylaria nigripes]